MKKIKLNIENLTSLWQTVSEPVDSFFMEKEYRYSLIEKSEWPNRLWLNQGISPQNIAMIKAKMASSLTNLTLPIWDIYPNNSLEILAKNGFTLKFEQIGMSLNRKHVFPVPGTLNLKKVTTQKQAQLWSDLFRKSFGYLIHPILISNSHKNTTFYLAFHGKVAVGTGILHTSTGASGIHSVGIIPEQRRKGYAEQIMKLIINESLQTQNQLITLQASNMGKALYLKLGFEEQFTIKNYTLKRPSN